MNERVSAGIITIRPTRRDDLVTLTQIHNQIWPEDTCSEASIRARMEGCRQVGGRSWVALEGSVQVGYGTATPVPALDGVYDLDGGVIPSRQRQGIATRLLNRLGEDLRKDGARQMNFALTDLENPAAKFFKRQGFFNEHEEWRMLLADLDGIPEPVFPPGFEARTLPLIQAVLEFRRLYELSFQGLPWYQPYLDNREVMAELVNPDDLWFLFDRQRAVGFIWLRWPDIDVAALEPLGIIPEYQGRGLARPFISLGLRKLSSMGARSVTLGVWRQNERAINLYQELGFRTTDTVVYLAKNL